MMKTILKGVAVALSYFLVWYVFSLVNWMSLFQIEKVSSDTEKKLGELFWESLKKYETVIKDKEVVNSVDSIVNRICKGSEIERKSVQVHILKSTDVNAFALPGGHLVVLSGLINDAESPEALAGVLAHEIAHIERKHVSKKLVKELGITALAGIAAGGAGGEVVKQAVKTLSSSAFDRKMEKEADLKAVDYMVNAQIDPMPFSALMDQFAEDQPELLTDLSWLSTHPDSKERAVYIREYAQKKDYTSKTLLYPSTWEALQHKVGGGDDLEEEGED
jgi:predicted Zn-dependent protease